MRERSAPGRDTPCMSMLSRIARVARGAALLSIAVPGWASAQDDVSMLGRIYGTRPPAAYFELRNRLDGAFEFGRAWKARSGRPGDPRIAPPTRQAEGGVAAPAAVLGHRDGSVTGTFRFPLVLGYFGDDAGPPAFSVADVQREFFDGPNSRYKTIPEYYDEVSGGRVELIGETFGWVQSGLTRVETTANVSALGGLVGLFIQELLAAADDGSVDWGQYDNDGPDGVPDSGDDDGFVDILAVFHPTFGAECGGPGQQDRVWAHKWSLSQAYFSIPPAQRPSEATFETSTISASGQPIRIDDYTIQPVLSCDETSINEIGVLAHELGHGFGLPDLYCTSTGCVSGGIGRWGLMGSGSWGCGSFNPSRPCHLGAWSKSVLGWADVVTLPPATDHGVRTLEAVESSGTVFRVDAEDGSDEYYLLENRQRVGFDAELPGTGLLVWHVDPDYVLARWPANAVNPEPNMGRHLGVRVRQADGRFDIEGGINRSDAGDPFPGLRGTQVFHAGSAPQSVTHEGNAAGVTLTEIEESGATVSFRAVSGLRTVTLGVQGAGTSGLLLADDVPVPLGGLSLQRAPFEGVVLNAAAGESLGDGIRRPFAGWSDAPSAARVRVFITPLESDASVSAVYGGEEVRLDTQLEGGILGVPPGSIATTPPSSDLWIPAGEPVSLRAVPAGGHAFLGWLGEWAGRPNPFSVTAMAPLTIGAEFGLTFSSLAYSLAVGPGGLDPALREALDGFGNANGRYDIGDLRAYLKRGGTPLAASSASAGGER